MGWLGVVKPDLKPLSSVTEQELDRCVDTGDQHFRGQPGHFREDKAGVADEVVAVFLPVQGEVDAWCLDPVILEQQLYRAVKIFAGHCSVAEGAVGVDIEPLSGAQSDGAIRGVTGCQLSHPFEGLVVDQVIAAEVAHAILSNPDCMAGATPVMKDLWRWHAVEETEHKAVAFDIYQRCLGDERLRRIVFLFVTFHFFKYTFLNTCSMLRTEGKLWSLKTWLGGINYLWGKPGILRKCLSDFLAYMRKGFHPW